MPLNVQQFHALTIKHAGIANRILMAVSISSAFNPANPPNPLPKTITKVALWDTGATQTFLTERCITELGLVPTGIGLMNHAGGSEPCNTYIVNLMLPQNVQIYGLPAMQCRNQTGFDIIIGMDIITKGDFSITNRNGQTWLSFRIPSVGSIDYVDDADRLTKAAFKAQAGRNDPCPCGKRDRTGKPVKFKKCHGA